MIRYSDSPLRYSLRPTCTSGLSMSKNCEELSKVSVASAKPDGFLLEEPLKALGQYEVKVKLGYGVTGTVTVWVVQE